MLRFGDYFLLNTINRPCDQGQNLFQEITLIQGFIFILKAVFSWNLSPELHTPTLQSITGIPTSKPCYSLTSNRMNISFITVLSTHHPAWKQGSFLALSSFRRNPHDQSTKALSAPPSVSPTPFFFISHFRSH